MSLFTQTSTALAALVTQWESLSGEVADQIEILTDLQQQQANGAIELEVLLPLLESSAAVSTSLAAFDTQLQSTVATVNKFHSKAEEGKKNPDAQIYGSGMLLKI